LIYGGKSVYDDNFFLKLFHFFFEETDTERASLSEFPWSSEKMILKHWLISTWKERSSILCCTYVHYARSFKKEIHLEKIERKERDNLKLERSLKVFCSLWREFLRLSINTCQELFHNLGEFIANTFEGIMKIQFWDFIDFLELLMVMKVKSLSLVIIIHLNIHHKS
jgi:hypothetical protein